MYTNFNQLTVVEYFNDLSNSVDVASTQTHEEQVGEDLVEE